MTVSDPPPTYTWSREGVRVTGNEEGVDVTSDGRITLSSAKVSDAGMSGLRKLLLARLFMISKRDLRCLQ